MLSWRALWVDSHHLLASIVSWVSLSAYVHCVRLPLPVGLNCELAWWGKSYVRTKNLWSFMLRVVEGRHDGRRPEDIRWSRVDVAERSGSTWNRSTSYPPPRILGWVEVRWGWVSAVWGSTQLWVLRGGWGTPLGRMVKGSTWRTCSFKFEV